MRLADDVTDPPTSIHGAGYTAEIAPGATVDFPTRDGAASLLLATRKDGTSLAAVAISSTSLKQTPLVVGYESTAFAMLLMSTEYVTDNPLVIAYLRGLAAQSPHLDKLAGALKAADGAQARAELGALGADVASALDKGTSKPATAPTGRVEPAAYVLSGDRATQDVPRVGGLAVDCPGSVTDDGVSASVGLCLSSTDVDKADVRALKVVNRSRSWVAIYSDPTLVAAGLPDTLVEPSVVGGILISDLIENVLKYAAGNVAKLACAGVKFLGVTCPKDDLDQFTNQLLKMSPSPDGQATVLVTPTSGSAPTWVVSMMHGSPISSQGIPSGVEASGVEVTALLNIWTMGVQPALNLAAGIRHISNEPDTGPAAATGIRLLVKAAGQIGDLQPLLSAAAAKDPVKVTKAIAVLGATLIGDRDLLEALAKYCLNDALPTFAVESLMHLANTLVIKGVPVIGQVIGAADVATESVSALLQVGKFLQTFNLQPGTAQIEPLWYHAIKGDPRALSAARSAVVASTDWANFDYPRTYGSVPPDYWFPTDVALAPTVAAVRDGHTQVGAEAVDLVGEVPTTSGESTYVVLFIRKEGSTTGGVSPRLCYYRVTARYLERAVTASACASAMFTGNTSGRFEYQADGDDLIVRSSTAGRNLQDDLNTPLPMGEGLTATYLPGEGEVFDAVRVSDTGNGLLKQTHYLDDPRVVGAARPLRPAVVCQTRTCNDRFSNVALTFDSSEHGLDVYQTFPLLDRNHQPIRQ